MTFRQRCALWGVIGLFAACLGVAFYPAPAHGQEINVPALIADAADRHGADAHLMQRVAWCESSYRPYVVGPWGHVGTFQWEYRSFAEEARWMGLVDASPWDVWANVEVAAFAMANGRAWRWRACL